MSWALIPLTEEQREIQRTARDFARAEIAPHSDAWDRAEAYDVGIVSKLAELGFLGMLRGFRRVFIQQDTARANCTLRGFRTGHEITNVVGSNSSH